jgi:enoyl-CoA hydratase/carnithine racemase
LETYERLLYEEEDGVAIVTLNRPEVHNAFDQQMQAELRGAVAITAPERRRAGRDPDRRR